MRDRLLADYRDAVDELSQNAEALATFTGSPEDYQRFLEATDMAKFYAERARMACEEHRAGHGC